MTLKNRQILFIAEYIKNQDGKAAAIKAGYKESGAASQASKLLAKDDIKTEIENRQKLLADENLVTKKEIVLDLLRIKDDAMMGKLHIKDGLKAIEIINKMLGYNEQDSIDTTNIQINYIKPEQI